MSNQQIGKYVSCCPDGKYSEHLYNQAINDCTIITTKLLAEKDKEIYSLKFQNDCKSDLCECSDIYGFPCYRHLQEAYNEAMDEIKRLKGEVIRLAFLLRKKQLKKASKQLKLNNKAIRQAQQDKLNKR